MTWKYCKRTRSFRNFCARIRKSAEILKYNSQWPSENMKTF